jgi:hypothetical protein
MVNLSKTGKDVEMKRISLLAVIGVVLLLGANAFAQDQPTNIEVALDYSLLNFHPGAAGLVFNVVNFNGGGGSFVYYTPLHWLGIKADFQGYGSTTRNFTIPAGNSIIPQGGQFNVQANMFTYQFGPVFKKRGRWEPYAQVLFGGAHSNVYGDLFRNVTTINPLPVGPSSVTSQTGIGSTAPSNNAFAMNVGFGLDVHLNRRISLRPVEVGYQMTRFGNPFSGNDTQQNFRYVAGVLFNF